MPPRDAGGRGRGRGRLSYLKEANNAQEKIIDTMLLQESKFHQGLGFRGIQNQVLLSKPIAFVKGKDQPYLVVDRDPEVILHPTLVDSDEEEEEDDILFVPPARQPPPNDKPVQEAIIEDPIIIETESLIIQEAPVVFTVETSAPVQSTTSSVQDVDPPPDDSFASQQDIISLEDAIPKVKPAKPTAAHKRKQKREGRARRKSASKISSPYISKIGRPTHIDSADDDVELPRQSDVKLKWKGKGRIVDVDVLLADYLENATADDMNDLANSSFSKSLDTPLGHVTADMLEDEARLAEAKMDAGWETSEGSEADDVLRLEEALILGESSDDEVEADVEIADTHIEWVEEDSSDEESGTSESNSSESSDQYEDEDEEESPENEWRSLNAKGDVQKKRLYQAIESGDFDSIEDELLNFDCKAPKGKNKQPAFDSDDEFYLQLQEQWQKDRQRKSDRRRARLQSRIESQPTKANIKKAKRAGVEIKPMHGVDLHSVHVSIKDFLATPDRPALNLPPMDKKQRVAVHLLAECYHLKSQSRGSGPRRFPTLTRTALSSLAGANHSKIATILGAARGDVPAIYQGQSSGGRYKTLWRELSGQKGSGHSTPRNKNGQLVGEGAGKIGEDNIGYQLLMRMGWDESKKIGLSGGLAAPLNAVIKTNRGGLGA